MKKKNREEAPARVTRVQQLLGDRGGRGCDVGSGPAAAVPIIKWALRFLQDKDETLPVHADPKGN